MSGDYDPRRITLGTRRGVKVWQQGCYEVVDGSTCLLTDPRIGYDASYGIEPPAVNTEWFPARIDPARPGQLWCSSPYHDIPGDDGWRPAAQFADDDERASGKNPWCNACVERLARKTREEQTADLDAAIHNWRRAAGAPGY